jgi:hypothetical protein
VSVSFQSSAFRDSSPEHSWLQPGALTACRKQSNAAARDRAGKTTMPLHRDYEICWRNYRGFENTERIAIRPLTILLGPNNAGKTSIISPLLLLNQTMISRDSETPLVTSGALVDAGHFKDIIHNHDTSKSLFFGFYYHLHERLRKRRQIQGVGAYPPGAIEVTIGASKASQNMVLQNFEVFDVYERLFLQKTRRRDGSYSLKAKALGKMAPEEKYAIAHTKPVNFLFSPAATLNMLRRRSTAAQGSLGSDGEIADRPPSRKLTPAFALYLGTIATVFDELLRILRDLSYIGPLRERLRRYYEVSEEMPPSVGVHGQHMATLIHRRPDLKAPLNSWVQRFGFGTELISEELSAEVFSLFFVGHNPSVKTNVADAGFGASQVLPLIVQSLAAETDSLTFAEQPEIHLNPDLQAALADLFVDMANRDQTVVVETHSEHLFLRLRTLVAEKRIEHAKVAIYFVEKDNGISIVKNIPVQQNGHISSEAWPKGFFEQTLKESLALATAQSRGESKAD